MQEPALIRLQHGSLKNFPAAASESGGNRVRTCSLAEWKAAKKWPDCRMQLNLHALHMVTEVYYGRAALPLGSSKAISCQITGGRNVFKLQGDVRACRLAEWKAAKKRPDCRRRASRSVADSLPQKASPAPRMVCVHSSTCAEGVT